MINKSEIKVVFFSESRADYGKLKALFSTLANSALFKPTFYLTGAHTSESYGYTYKQVLNDFSEDLVVVDVIENSESKATIIPEITKKFSNYIRMSKPDAIVIHGDRIEALAATLSAKANNISVVHIEGGEKSGNLDDSIRHSISKLSDLHFVANQTSQKRLLQLGEDINRIKIIGSPDIDLVMTSDLKLNEVKNSLGIDFTDYCILLFHPEDSYEGTINGITSIIDVLNETRTKTIVVKSNNDKYHEVIDYKLNEFSQNENVMYFSSIHFESFLCLVKHARFIVGNSSCGIRQAPYFGTPVINVGNRQRNRDESSSSLIINASNEKLSIEESIFLSSKMPNKSEQNFGDGNASSKFCEIMSRLHDYSSLNSKQFIDNQIEVTHV